MKKKLVLNISIPKPCTENWENMTPAEQGRHCASCNKTVTDFSLYSDRQLIEFFSKDTSNICGRVTRYQIENPLVYVEATRPSFFQRMLVGIAFALGLSSSVNAQQNGVKPQQLKSIGKKKPAQKKTMPPLQSASINKIEPINTSNDTTDVAKAKTPEHEIVCMVGGAIGAITTMYVTDIGQGIGRGFSAEEIIRGLGQNNTSSIHPHSAFAPKFRDGDGR